MKDQFQHTVHSQSWIYGASTAMLELTSKELTILHAKEPPFLAETIGLLALFAVCTCLTAISTLKKTRPTGYVFWYETQRKKKSKRNWVTFTWQFQLTMMSHHNVSASLHHLKALFEINPHLAPLLHALCSAAKFFYFNEWLKSDSGQWHHFAITLRKPGAGSVSSALWVHNSACFYS